VVVSDIVVVVMKSAEMRVSSVDTMLERCHAIVHLKSYVLLCHCLWYLWRF
jgi:hypothetical protein